MLPDDVRKAMERDWSVAMENAGVLRSLSKLDKRFDKLAHIADQLIELCADHRTLSAHLLAREAEVERLRRSLERAQCYHRCSRIHPHCQLTIARIGAPDNLWRWHVTMPDGHIFATSGAGNSFQTLGECVADAQTNGREWLEKADAIWRESHPRITAHLSENSRG